MREYYKDDWCTIYHGDCKDILPEVSAVDLVLTDPPYGIGVDLAMHKKSGEQYGKSAAPNGIYDYSNWDHSPPDKLLLLEIIKYGKNSVIWGGNYFELPPTRCVLVWDKINDVGNNAFSDCELAWTNFDKPVRIKHHIWNGMIRKNKEARHHPTQKPLEIIQWCITMCPDNPQTILDPFMGSGTTLRAAKDLNRKAIGIEIEEKYCEIAAMRLQQEVLDLR